MVSREAHALLHMTTMAMANANRLLSVGEFMRNEGRLRYIQDIKNNLGFNQYFIINCDSGVVLKRSRYQLKPSTLDIPALADDTSFNEDVRMATEREEKKTWKRFLSVSREDLDSIEVNRTIHRTRQQTLWAVTILKGGYTTRDFKYKNKSYCCW